MVRGEICKDSSEWLERSVVVEFFKPINLKLISELLPRIWYGVLDIRDVGSFMAKEAMKKALASSVDSISSRFFE